MKFLLTICLLLISIPAIAGTPRKSVGSGQYAVSRLQNRLSKVSLTRKQTREAERRLSDMGYWTGPVDGRFDPATRSALIAFQKWEGRPVTGRLTPDELDAIRTSTSPTAREPGYAHVEVDLDRQVMLMVNENDGIRVLPISSGSGKPFVDEGQTSICPHTARQVRCLRKGRRLGEWSVQRDVLL
jgi:peptidoglycan hydrolase-like protein with peptidoglycan-binding domain